MRKELKLIIGIILFVVAWGIIGNDEYEFEKRQESVTINKSK